MNAVIQEAISIVGSQSELARRVGVDQSAVSKWLCGGGIRARYIPAIIAASNGKLTADQVINSLKIDEKQR